MQIRTILLGIKETLNNVIGYFLLASPAIVAYYLWEFLMPLTCIEKILSLFGILTLCIIEGIVSWEIGLKILE